jgi:aryl-alcohol dehydrogenase-like predicted oxidoreductase
LARCAFQETTPGDDSKSNTGERALSRALERGVNFLHSSYEYGTRWAMERVLREHPQRAEIKHIIKVPVPDFKDDAFSADKFRMRIEEALRELHTDQIHSRAVALARRSQRRRASHSARCRVFGRNAGNFQYAAR